MVTQSNRKFLSELVARLAFHDYYQANQENLKKPLRKDGTRPYTPYSLSDETLEAQEMYERACKLNPTKEDEEAVKAYILKAKFRRAELRHKK